jgi:hypothetical protein
MTSPTRSPKRLFSLGVKVSKNPSEEAPGMGPKLLRVGIVLRPIRFTLTGLRILNMFISLDIILLQKSPSIWTGKTLIQGKAEFRISILSSTFNNIFDIKVRNGDSQGQEGYPPSFGISAFLKGPHQLGSKIPKYRGEKPSPGTEVRSHHITPHLQTRAPVLLTSTVLPFLAHPGTRSFGRILSSGWTLDRRVFRVKEITLRRKRIGKYDFSNSFTEEVLPSRSKGIQESFRRGPRDGAETPKPWNSRLAHKIHPYWSTNLKYVY